MAGKVRSLGGFGSLYLVLVDAVRSSFDGSGNVGLLSFQIWDLGGRDVCGFIYG